RAPSGLAARGRMAKFRASGARRNRGAGMKSARLEAYLVLLQRELRKRGIEDARILDEVRDHLADAVERGLHLGMSVDVAEREALTQFGAADTVAAHFVRGRSGMLRRSLDGVAA